MSAQLKSFEGPDVQLLLDRIRTELGPGAKIDGAEKIRVGGVMGFFAKEHYRVVVEVPESAGDVPVSAAVVEPAPADPRSSRRARRKSAATKEPQALAAPTEPVALPEPLAVAAGPSPAAPADVFSAMAEATDDVNDIGAEAEASSAAALAAPAAAPPPPAVVTAGPGSEAATLVEPAVDDVAESFDAVLTRVASTLEVDTGAVPARLPSGAALPSATGLPAGSGTPADGNGPDIPGAPGSIASRAAVFLAETSGTAPAAEPTPTAPPPDTPGALPGPQDALAGALRRVGLDETLVAAVVEGQRRGGRLESQLLEVFADLPPAPALPRRAGSLLVVVGAGTPARRLAAALAGEIGVDPAAVPYASRDSEAYAVVTGKLLRSADEAAELAPGWRRSEAAVVVVDAPLTSTERTWAGHLIAALRPTAVWGVVDSTAKTEDIEMWAEAIGGVDALALENLDATVSPAAALGAGIPVGRLDGQMATASRWAAIIGDRVDPCT